MKQEAVGSQHASRMSVGAIEQLAGVPFAPMHTQYIHGST
jgi:hypothetical protein